MSYKAYRLLCIFLCSIVLCLEGCTASTPTYIEFTQPQAGFSIHVPSDWSQQTTVLSEEIVNAYPDGFDADYVNNCEQAAYVASWNIPGQSANISIMLIRPSAFSFDLFDANAMLEYLGLDASEYNLSLADTQALLQEKTTIDTVVFAGTLTPKVAESGSRCAAWRVVLSDRGAYIFTADWTYGDEQVLSIFETMLRSFVVL